MQNQLQSEAVTKFMNDADDNIICHEIKYEMLICRKHEYVVQNLHDYFHDKHTIIDIEQYYIIIKRYT